MALQSHSPTPIPTVHMLQAHLHRRGQLPKPGFLFSLTFTKSPILKIFSAILPRTLSAEQREEEGKGSGMEEEQTCSLPSHRCTLQAWEVTSGPPPVPWISASAGHRRAAVGSVPPPPGPDSSAPKGKAHMHPDLRTLLGLTCSLRLMLAWREPWEGIAHVLDKKGREFTLLPQRGLSLGTAPDSTQHHHQIVWLLFPLS